MICYKKNRIGMCLLLSVVVFMNACSSTSFLIVTNDSHEKKITIKKGTIFKIQLKAQLGTGYSWLIKSKNPHLKLIGKPETVTLEEDKTGAMDYQIFTFQAVQTGSTQLLMHYIQPWEKKFIPASIFKLTIKIVE